MAETTLHDGELGHMIGLEIHAQLRTESKLFCDCSTDYQKAKGPNEQICPTCTAQPGTKPFAINAKAMEQAMKIMLALECEEISERIIMQRKHYFYPDLPSNYQRTSTPLGKKGKLAGVSIWEVHIEEDPGRYDLKTGLVDYNRAGVPLIEIVTAPEITSPDHARKFLDELRAILDYLEAARSDDAGSMRADANVSVGGHNRVEVKNINSTHGVFSALTYEISRQKNMVKNGLEIIQETRHYDEEREITIGLRKKETVDDYRYIPDPDVQPIALDKKRLEEIRKSMPELPRQKMERFKKQYGASDDEAHVLCSERAMADEYEKAAKQTDPKTAAVFFRGVLKKQLNWRGMPFGDFVSRGFAAGLEEILSLLSSGKITDKVSEKLLIDLLDGKIPTVAGSIEKYSKENGLIGMAGPGELSTLVAMALEQNTQAVKDYKNGEAKALQFLAGKIIGESMGKADPELVQKMLKEKLGANTK